MAVRELKYPFKAKRGVDNTYVFRMYEADGVTPISLAGRSFRTDLRYNVNDPNEIAVLSSDNGGFTLDGNDLVMKLSAQVLGLLDMSKGNTHCLIPFVNILFDIEYNEGGSPLVWQPFVMGVVRVSEQTSRTNDL